MIMYGKEEKAETAGARPGKKQLEWLFLRLPMLPNETLVCQD
jgi:hypothetical protein